MPFALVPFVDVGPSHRPGRRRTQPLGLDQGGNAVHLGRRRALIYTPYEIRDPRAIPLCDDGADRLLNRRRRHVQALLPDRIVRPHLRFGEMVGWALKTPPRGTWGRLRPHLHRRQFEVLLGPGGPSATPTLWRQDALVRGPHSKDIQDTFERADSGLNGSTSSDSQFTWSLPIGNPALVVIISGIVYIQRSGSDHFAVALASLAMDTADAYTQASLSQITNVGAAEVGVRMTNGTGTGDSGYAFAVDTGPSRRIYDFVTDATIASDAGTTANGVLKISMIGSTYLCTRTGVTIFTGTNTTYPGTGSQRKGSLHGFAATSNSSSVQFSDFRVADIAGAGTVSLDHAEARGMWRGMMVGAR